MIRIYITALLLLCAGFTFAQKTVSGKILDEKAQAIPFASVMILRHTDSVKTNTAMTDTSGNFSLSGIPSGKYLVKVSYIGYLDFYSQLIEVNDAKKTHHFAAINLTADSRLLNTVNIKGAKPLIEQTLDRTVMNIEKSIMAEGNTAMELLAKAPGVTVTDGGEVSLKGRAGTSVMINGKPTYLSGDQLANLLRGTSSSAISRIELMANPSARFDAAGSGGIINIILKKNTLTGVNGSISGNIGSGRGIRYGEGASLNYRTNSLNIYSSYNANNQDLKSYSSGARQFSSGNQTQRISQQSEENAKLRSHNFRVGADLNLGEQNTLGFLLNGAIGKYPVTQPGTNQFFNQNGTLIWNAVTQTTGNEHWEDLLYNVNYVHRFKKEGHEIKADVDYVSHFSRMEQLLDTRYADASGALLRDPASRRGNIPSNDDIYAAKIDYILPLSKSSKIEAGWKGSDVTTENNLQYDTLSNGQFTVDGSTSNHFIYKEKIQAAYLNFNTSWGKYSLQAGLRAEYTATKGHQLTTDSVFKRNYTGLFPSVFITRELSESHQLKAGYSRRIKRPGYWDLNPFRVYEDPFSFYEGNPYLKPAMVNGLELGYAYKSRYFTNLSYNHTSNVISEKVGQVNDGNVTFERPDNLGSFTNIGISFTASTSIFKWWTGSQFLNVYHNRYKINNSSGTVNNSGSTVTFNSQNTFTIGKGWKAELSALYHSKEVRGTTTTSAYSNISSGVQKEVLNSRGTIKLMVNDIFRGYQIKQTMNYENTMTYNRTNSDTRYGQVSFSYRFGGNQAPSRERSTSSEELKGRLK